MKLQKFTRRAIQTGMDADPRGRAAVERDLLEIRKTYDDLKPEERSGLDLEKLSNPCADSRILHGNPDRAVKKVLVGSDIEAPCSKLQGALILTLGSSSDSHADPAASCPECARCRIQIAARSMVSSRSSVAQ